MSIEGASSAVWADYVHPSDVAIFDDAHEGAHKTGQLDAEYRIVGADGCVRWVRDRGRLRNEDGRRLLDGSVLDVTAIKTTREALEAARAEAQRAAQIDPLTGVANRRSLSPRLEAFGDRPIGVLSIDVDDFKNINDLFGHAAGDAVLVAVSAGLQEATREGDAIFRMGGEEFLVILADLCDDIALLDVAEAVRRRIETEPVPYAGERIELTASIGAARSDSPAGNIDSLLAAADRALYVAKRGGRNRVQLASPEDEHEHRIVDGGFTLRLAQAMASVVAAAGTSEQSHVTEVSQLAARIARRLGSPPPQVLRCRLAGLLHNVGMVQVPRNETDHELVRRRAQLGEALIAAVPDLRPIAPIVREHGENFDGSGYPDGIAGDEILLEARIVAAANTWSAMTNARPHRPALDERAALLQLDQVAGTQLDPRVVDALKSVLAHPREADAR
jgi:diguanylate cyclase (GGDEF)-like protein